MVVCWVDTPLSGVCWVSAKLGVRGEGDGVVFPEVVFPSGVSKASVLS